MQFTVCALNKTYNGKDFALKNISFHVGGPGLYLITGKNGSGKTTLFNLIAGLDKPTSGHVYFNGIAVDEMGEKQICSYRRNHIAYIFQDFNLIPELNVFSNVMLAALDRESAANALAKVGMADFSNKKAEELSEGQKQRVAIARALSADKDIILADEPTASLDAEIRKEIVGLLHDLSKERTVFVISHDENIFEETGYDGKIELKNGRMANFTQKEDDGESAENHCVHKKVKSKNFLSEYLKTRLLRKKAKKAYLSLFSVILLSAAVIGISSVTNNYADMILDTLRMNDCKYVVVGTKEDISGKGEYLNDNNYTAKLSYDYNGADKDDLYFLPLFYGETDHVLEASSDIDLIAGRNPQERNEVVITDYIAEYIMRFGGIEGEKYNSYYNILSEGKLSMEFAGNVFKQDIVGIAATDCGKYADIKEGISLSYAVEEEIFRQPLSWNIDSFIEKSATSEDREYYFFLVNVLYYYNCIYVCEDFEKDGYAELTSLRTSDISENSNMPLYYTVKRIEDEEELPIYGSCEGIVAPLSKLYTPSELDELYGRYGSAEKVCLAIKEELQWETVLNLTESVFGRFTEYDPFAVIFSEKYHVTGFYDDYFGGEEKDIYYLPGAEFSRITDALSDYDSEYTNVYVRVDNPNDFKQLVDLIVKDHAPNDDISFPYKSILDKGYKNLNTLQAVLIFVSIFAGAITLLYIVQIVTEDIKSGERDYAVLKSLGYKNKDILLCAVVSPLVVLAVSFILSVAACFILCKPLNVYLVNGFLNIPIVSVTGFGVVAAVASIAVGLFAGVFFGMRRLFKQPPIRILKANRA